MNLSAQNWTMGFIEDEESILVTYKTLKNSSSNSIILQDSLPYEFTIVENDSVQINSSSVHSSSDLLIAFLVQGLALTCVSCLGLMGNLLTVITFSRMRKKSSFMCLLLGLTFCDSVFILTSILIFGLPGIFEYLQIFPFYSQFLYPLFVLYLYPVAQSAQTGSVYFTVVVTLERWFVICQPFKSRTKGWTTWKRGVYMTILILIFSFLFNIPRWWEYRVVSVSRDDGRHILRLNTTDLRVNKIFVEYYMHYGYLLTIFFLPITILVSFNWIIYKQIRVINKTRQELLSVSQKSEISLALVLVIIVVVFLLCNFLPLLNNVMELYYNCVDIKLLNIANFLVALNSSVNVLIYYTTFRGKYRKYFYETCYKFFCCCRPCCPSLNPIGSGGREMRHVVGFAANRRQAFHATPVSRLNSNPSTSGSSCARSSDLTISSSPSRSIENHQTLS